MSGLQAETSCLKLCRISVEIHECEAISDEISYPNRRLKLSLILAKMESWEVKGGENDGQISKRVQIEQMGGIKGKIALR